MGIQALPVELLLPIVDHLGPDFFREDARRLSLFKRWHSVAWALFVRDLQLTSRALIGFARNDGMLLRSLPHVVSITLSLQSYGTRGTPASTKTWTARLNAALAKLAAAVPLFPRLQRVTLVAELPELFAEQVHGFLDTWSVNTLLRGCAAGITSLDLDLTDCYAPPRLGTFGVYGDPGMHLCSALRGLLPSLQRLRCRMDRLCESLLEPPPPGTLLDIREILIMLRIERTETARPLNRWVKKCPPTKHASAYAVPRTMPGEFRPFRQAIEQQATAFCRHLRQPRMVRILSHDLIDGYVPAWDALAERRIRLHPGAAWDSEEM